MSQTADDSDTMMSVIVFNSVEENNDNEHVDSVLFDHCKYFTIRSTGRFEQAVHFSAISVVFVV